jgi:cytochrome b561
LQLVATLLHFTLYIALIVTVSLGVANVWVRGDTLFNIITFPAFDPGNKPLRAQVGDLHDLAANTLLVLAGLHAIAALIHHFVWRDDVLRRMLPARGRDGGDLRIEL